MMAAFQFPYSIFGGFNIQLYGSNAKVGNHIKMNMQAYLATSLTILLEFDVSGGGLNRALTVFVN